jgi:hypothetical protein
MVDAQTLTTMFGGIGVGVAAFYYVMTLRAQRENMKHTLETRQIQLLMQLSEFITTKEGMKNYLEFNNMEWTDYDDFEKKYGSDVNPDSYALRESMAGWFNRAGTLLRDGILDKILLYDFLGIATISLWNKYGENVRTQRDLYGMPWLWRDWEYLYDEMVKIGAERGFDTRYKEEPRYTDEMRRKLAAESA